MNGFSTVLGLALLCWAAVPGQAVRATTVESIDLEQLARSSDVIVRGRVVSVVAFPRGPNGLPGIHTRIEIAAEEFLAGTPLSLVHFWVQGGDHGDLRRVVAGQATFEEGEEVLVFLSEHGAGVLFPTGMGRGKWFVHERRPGAAPELAPAVRLAANHAPDRSELPDARLTLEELRRRVRAARGAR